MSHEIVPTPQPTPSQEGGTIGTPENVSGLRLLSDLAGEQNVSESRLLHALLDSAIPIYVPTDARLAEVAAKAKNSPECEWDAALSDLKRRLGASGGKATAEKRTPKERSEAARLAAHARWEKTRQK